MYLSSHIAGLVAAAKYFLGLSPPPPTPNSNLQSDPSKDEVLLSPLEGLTLEDPKSDQH